MQKFNEEITGNKAILDGIKNKDKGDDKKKKPTKKKK